MAASTFIDTIETLSRCMSESAAHLAAYLKVTEPSHAAYGVLHRLERVLVRCLHSNRFRSGAAHPNNARQACGGRT